MNAAIVTGAGGAIGRATALRLASCGRPIVCADVADTAEATRDDIRRAGGRAEAVLVDLTGPSAAASIWAATEDFGGASALINNAGITRDARASDMSLVDFREVIRVDAVAPLELTRALAPRLAEGGCVVNVASRAAFGNFGQANYVTAKAALVGATRAMGRELAPRLRVNCVAPGLTETPMTAAMPVDVLEKLTARIPMGRAARPSEIASVVAFLASDEASYVTGQMLVACGARSIVG